MARNFFENGYQLFYPQVDWGGAGPGFVESEFPLMPFLVALLYRVFGVHEWFGRAFASICSLIAGYALFHLVRRTSGERVALWASAFYLFLPLSLFYSRAFMPDSVMMAASILAVAWFFEWTETGESVYWVGSAMCLSLACLLKLPCLYLGLPIIYVASLRFGSTFWRQGSLWVYAIGVLLPVVVWYAHAHRILLDGGLTFGIWEYGSDKWGNWDLVTSSRFWNGLIFRSLAERWLTWVGFPFALIAVLMVPRNVNERLFDYWLVAVFVFFVIVAKGNYVHEYYQWPILPAASFYLAKVFAPALDFRRWRVRASACLVAIVAIIALGYLRYATYMRKEELGKSLQYALAKEVDRQTDVGAKVVAVDSGNPTILYLSHRKGWHASPDQVDADFLTQRIREGAGYVVALLPRGDQAAKRMRERIREYSHRPLLDNGSMMIYRLRE